jgi:3-mercaptopyruvate sulfurtransferase SseA
MKEGSMNKFKIIWLFIFLASSVVIIYGEINEVKKLVSTNWFGGNIQNEKLILLHYGKPIEFEKEYIPNARFISAREIIADNKNGFNHELPDIEKPQSVFRSWGINND